MSADCLFCKIAAKQIPSKIVYEDADIFAFEDISPQAPTHILLLPRKHFVSLDDATLEDQAVIGKLHLVAAQLARERNLLAGYRTVFNNGTGAGQSVFPSPSAPARRPPIPLAARVDRSNKLDEVAFAALFWK